MNILLTNYRYFVSGGPERYLFNAKELFEEKGHKVIPFSVKHPRNLPSEYSHYFLSALTDSEEAVTFRQLKLTPKNLIKLIDRTFLSVEARGRMKRLLRDNDVDVAYTLHFLRWISPSIFAELSKRGVPIVVRVSDFEYMCPGTHLLRDGEVCELCVGGSLLASVKYRCVQGSLPLSLAHYASMSLYKAMGTMKKIDAFVCPSRFTLRQMKKAGFAEEKLFHVPTFVNTQAIPPRSDVPGEYILYSGRLSPEKGVEVLLEAFEKYRKRSGAAAIPLHIIHTGGEGAGVLEERIKSGDLEDVVLLSGLPARDFYSYVGNAAFTVVPSLCYDNLPNVVLESYACGKAVIGSGLGSIPELVEDGGTGLLFEAGNSDDLADKITWLAGRRRECMNMGRKGRMLAESEYGGDLHHERLMGLFSGLM